MDRRTYLRQTAGLTALALGALAGCTAGPGGTLTPEPTATTQPPTASGPQTVTPTKTSFSITHRACGEGANDATIVIDGSTIQVDGVIRGSDTCDTAQLAEVDLTDGVLTVIVATVREEGSKTQACGQCLTDIEYAFETTVADSIPETIKVIHDSSLGREVVAEESAAE